MPALTLTAPDGKVITITPPPDAKPEDIQRTVDGLVAQLHAQSTTPTTADTGINAPLPSAPTSPFPVRFDTGGMSVADVARSAGPSGPVLASMGPVALRTVPAVVGGAVAGPPGALIAGGLGALGAQALEMSQGDRQSFNPGRALVDTAVGAIPGVSAIDNIASVPLRIAARGAAGAVTSGVAGAATNASEGQPWDATLGRDLSFGFGIGGAAETLKAAVSSFQLNRASARALKQFLQDNPPEEALKPAEAVAQKIDDGIADVTPPPPDQGPVWYHGSPIGHNEPLQPSDTGLVGRGIYMTDNPDVASSYARAVRATPIDPVELHQMAQPGAVLDMGDLLGRQPPGQFMMRVTGYDPQSQQLNGVRVDAAGKQIQDAPLTFYGPQMSRRGNAGTVRPVYAGVANPFNAESTYDVGTLPEPIRQALGDRLGDSGNVKGYTLINALIETQGDLDAVKTFKASGFDGIAHVGGQVTGETPHNVLVAFDPEQVTDAFSVRAGAQAGGPAAEAAPAGGGSGTTPPPPRKPPIADASDPSEFRQNSQFAKAPGLNDAMGVETPDAGAMSQDRIDRANARVDRLYPDSPPAARQAIQDITNNNLDAIEEQSRGTQSDARTAALARELFPNVTELPPRGSTANAEQMWNTLDTVGALQNKVDLLAQKIASGDNGDITKLAFATARQELATMQIAHVGYAAEAGRALRILRVYRGADLTKDPTFIRKALKLGANEEQIAAAITKFAPDDVAGKFQFLQNLQKPGASDYLRWYYLTNILSGPRTHERNMLGNATSIAFKTASTPVAGALDYTRAVIRGGERQVYAGETGRRIYGLVKGMPEGFRKALFMLSNGYTLDDIANVDVRPPEIPGGIATNLISRGLGAADEWWRTIAYTSELHGAAYTEARNQLAKEGVTGARLRDQLPDRIADLVASPTPKLVKQASAFAGRAVFQEDPGAVVSKLLGLRQAIDESLPIPAGSFIVPFVKTPANIFKQGVQASPAGFATKLGRESTRLGAQARGEAALGTALLAPVAWLAVNGRLSGSGPSDPAERDALYAQGWRPNSMRVPLSDATAQKLGINPSPAGEYWVNYSAFQPLSVPMAAVANGYEAWVDAHKKGDPVSPADVFGQVVGRVGNTTLQQSYLQGASAVFNALSDPERFGEQLVQGLAQGFVPLSGALSTTAQMQDPLRREAIGLEQGLSRGVPNLAGPVTRAMTGNAITESSALPPKLDAMGQPVANPSNPLLVPEVSPVMPDPVREELHRLDLDITPPQKRGTITVGQVKVPLAQQEDWALRRAKGMVTRLFVTRELQTPNYGQLPDMFRKRALDAQITAARSTVDNVATMLKLKKQPITTDALLAPFARIAGQQPAQ